MNRSNAADLPKPTTEKEKQKIIQMGSKLKSAYNNPCIKEQELSMNCLSENNSDKKICQPFFSNYSVCQKFWLHVKKDRRAQQISPELPCPEDRDRIRAEYMKKLNS